MCFRLIVVACSSVFFLIQLVVSLTIFLQRDGGRKTEYQYPCRAPPQTYRKARLVLINHLKRFLHIYNQLIKTGITLCLGFSVRN